MFDSHRMRNSNSSVPTCIGAVYRDFQRIAKAQDRTASELIRQAMEEFRARRIARSTTLADLSPASVGRVLAPLRRGDDLLDELLDDDRD